MDAQAVTAALLGFAASAFPAVSAPDHPALQSLTFSLTRIAPVPTRSHVAAWDLPALAAS
jgi:hypothetical protein